MLDVVSRGGEDDDQPRNEDLVWPKAVHLVRSNVRALRDLSPDLAGRSHCAWNSLLNVLAAVEHHEDPERCSMQAVGANLFGSWNDEPEIES